MPDLRLRAADTEQLDTGVPVTEALASLADLRFVNRWLGGKRALLAAVRPHVPAAPAGRRPRLLDVGCGSADVPAWLRARTAPAALLVGVDAKQLHLTQIVPGVRGVAADVRRLPFADGTFDLVTASLFVHHFDAGEVPEVLRELSRVSRRTIVVHDLRRARVPYVFGRLCFPLLFRSRVSVADGLVSIRRGFTAGELHAACAAAGLHAHVRRAWPYRLIVVASKGGP